MLAPVLSVVMPAHNEEDYLREGVEAVVDGLRQRGEAFELLVVENGSADATLAVAKELDSTYPEVRAMSHPEPDYGKSLRAGFLAATGEFGANFDVDYIDLDFLDQALVLLREEGGPTIVVGSKRGEGAEDTRGWPRRMVTATFTFVLHHVFGLKVADTHGMKAMRREPLVPLAERCQFGTDLFD